MRGQSQAALRLVGRTKAVQTPEGFGQDDFLEIVALAPPVIPQSLKMLMVAALFVRRVQKTAHAE